MKKSHKDTRVIIKSKSEIELPTCGSGSHSFLSSILEKRWLAKISRWFSKFWASSNGCNVIESWFLSTEGMWIGGMIDLSLEIMRIKTSSRMLLSLGKTIGVNIDSMIGFESLNRGSGSYSSSSSISWMDNLPKCQGFDFGQV